MKPRNNAFKPMVEALEDRMLMSAAPAIFATVPEGSNFNDTGALAQTVKTSPMMETQVLGKLSNYGDVDMYRIDLKKGQIFTAHADLAFVGGGFVGSGSAVHARMSLLDSHGNTLVAENARPDSDIGFQVSQAGTYFVRLGRDDGRFRPSSSTSVAYTLHVRPVSLDGGDSDPRLLQHTEGGLYAFLDGGDLTISGPVGHGFKILGNWQQALTRVDGLISSTYVCRDNIYIHTSGGLDIPLPHINDNDFRVTTLAGRFGDLFGEVKTEMFRSLTTELVNGFLNLDSPKENDHTWVKSKDMWLAAGEIGLKLGNDPVLQMTGAPLNPAVPYLFINGAVGVTSSVGNVSGNLGSLVIDPADPFVYIGTDLAGMAVRATEGNAHSSLGGAGIALSAHGLIPFTPVNAPTQFIDARGTPRALFGHLYVSADFDLAGIGLPLKIGGNVVLNLHGHTTDPLSPDSNATVNAVLRSLSTGGPGGTSAPPTDAGATASPPNASDDGSIWKNVSFGINGEVSLNLPLNAPVKRASNDLIDQMKDPGSTASAGNLSLVPDNWHMSLAAATLIYDGPHMATYFHGDVGNLFEGTKLADLDKLLPTPLKMHVDGAWQEGGKFFLDASGQSSVGPVERVVLARKFELPAQVASLITGKYYMPGARVVTTGAYLEAGLNVFGNGVTLSGRIDNHGHFALIGAVAVNLGSAIHGSLVVTMEWNGTSLSLNADLTGTVKTDIVRGDINAHINLFSADDKGHLRSSGGYGKAKVQVKTPAGWKTAASANVHVSGEALWFTALGVTVLAAL